MIETQLAHMTLREIFAGMQVCGVIRTQNLNLRSRMRSNHWSSLTGLQRYGSTAEWSRLYPYCIWSATYFIQEPTIQDFVSQFRLPLACCLLIYSSSPTRFCIIILALSAVFLLQIITYIQVILAMMRNRIFQVHLPPGRPLHLLSVVVESSSLYCRTRLILLVYSSSRSAILLVVTCNTIPLFSHKLSNSVVVLANMIEYEPSIYALIDTPNVGCTVVGSRYRKFPVIYRCHGITSLGFYG